MKDIICSLRSQRGIPLQNSGLFFYVCFFFQLVILSMASLTDRSETLYLWKTREKMVRYKNRHSGQNCGRRSLCPSSSTHSVTPRIQRSPGGFWWRRFSYLFSQGRTELMGNSQLFRLIIQSLCSVFRPLTRRRLRQSGVTRQSTNSTESAECFITTCWLFINLEKGEPGQKDRRFSE